MELLTKGGIQRTVLKELSSNLILTQINFSDIVK